MRPQSRRVLAATVRDPRRERSPRSIPVGPPRASEPRPWRHRRCRPTPGLRRARETPGHPRDDVRSTRFSWYEIEEVQLATTARESARGFAFEHYSEQSVARIKNQCMERTLRARAVSRGIFFERELEEGVQLDGRTAAQCVVDDHAARVNVSCPGEFRDPRACARGQPTQNPQIPITQFGSTICYTCL